MQSPLDLLDTALVTVSAAMQITCVETEHKSGVQIFCIQCSVSNYHSKTVTMSYTSKVFDYTIEWSLSYVAIASSQYIMYVNIVPLLLFDVNKDTILNLSTCSMHSATMSWECVTLQVGATY